MSTSIILLEKIYFHDNAQKVALDSAVKKVKEREYTIQVFLEQSNNILLSLRDSNFFKTYLAKGNNTKDIQDLFKTCAQSSVDFMQLRYIDKDGNEKIRVERELYGGKISVVPEKELQNKAHRYYFYHSMANELEKVNFSALDLNIEHGEVEIPYKPTMRAILPIKEDGKFGGIIIINYFMEEFLKKLVSAPLYDIVLYDDNGYIIYHHDDQKDWSLFKEEKYTIMQEYPKHDRQLLEKDFLHTNSFVMKKMEVSIAGGLHILLQLNKQYLENQAQKTREQYIWIIIFVIVLPLLLTYLLIKFFGKTLLNLDKVQTLNQQLKQQTYTDELTQLQNRKAYNEKLDELYAHYKRYNTTFSMLLFDIDLFKHINDTYGHLVGDEVLIKLAQIVRSNLRKTDYCFRIGGEEFMILLSNTRKKDAVVFAEKLRKTIEENLYVNDSEVVTISIGVVEIQENDTLESLYKRVDDNLYFSKEHGRNQVNSHL
ncbi:GGDEF domain-containing protein [Sulfurimonas sp.]|uniref:GGDEF domain-containing protein n=1 Tax=Sulfurimonas sp. TaxID=2022749 RepID=UPI003D0F5194